MALKDIAFVISLVIAVKNIEAIEVAGKCLKFGSDETKPDLVHGDWYCLSDNDNNEYCVYYACPIPDCDFPVTPVEGKCQYCHGTCTYDGAVFNLRDTFRCLDGRNFCRCYQNNGIITTLIAEHYQFMCGIRDSMETVRQRKLLK